MRKIKMALVATVVAVAMLLMTAPLALATTNVGGATSGAQTGTATASGGKTGVDVVMFAAVGAGLLGTGYLISRRAKA